MNIISKYRDLLSHGQKVFLCIVAGVIVGGGLLFLYLLRAHTYLADDSSACINCHIMTPYYATWMHSSHGRDATCNDCHVPHENIVRKYYFKGTDGMNHVYKFLTHQERQAIMAEDGSAEGQVQATDTGFQDSIVTQNEKFAELYPHEYETWAMTEDTTFESEYNGFQRKDVLEMQPDIVVN